MKKKRFYPTPKGPKPRDMQRIKDPSTLPIGKERLEKAVAHMGLASRREAKVLIADGKIKVNGNVIRETGYGINPEKDIISLKDLSITPKEALLVYKPRGIERTKT